MTDHSMHGSSLPRRVVISRSQVFISYRREGGYEMARLIYDGLNKRGYSAYMDVEGLKSGPFTPALLMEIDKATDVVVVLSPGSMARCHEPDDWLRKEISYAIGKQKNVVPVMLRGFDWPDEELPADMRELSGYHGLEPSIMLFEASMDKLAAMLVDRPTRKRIWIQMAATAAIILAVLAWRAPHFFGLDSKPPVQTVTSNDIEELSNRALAIAGKVGRDPMSIPDSRVEIVQIATRVSGSKRFTAETPGTVAAVYRLAAASLLFCPSGNPDREKLKQGVFWLEKLGEHNPQLDEELRLKVMRDFFRDYIDGRTISWDAGRAANYALTLALLVGTPQEIERSKAKVFESIRNGQ